MSTLTMMVEDLQAGFMVDLEGDPCADPFGAEGGSPFEFAYSVVESVEVGPAGEIVVAFDDALVAFPAGHAVQVERGGHVEPDWSADEHATAPDARDEHDETL